jgi:hypothetical protein
MARKLLFPLCLLGALIGGIPGGVLAFYFAAGTGIGGFAGEVICCVANLIFSVGGAFIGILFAKAIRGPSRIEVIEVVLPIILGLLCGIIGYAWLYWAISHADPPL